MANPQWWTTHFPASLADDPEKDPPSNSYFPLRKRYSRYIQRYLTEREWKRIATKRGESTDVSYPLTGVPIGSGCFGYRRIQGLRWHCGIDLAARYEDPIIACEDGEIIRVREFYQGTYCLFLKCADVVIMYGEIKEDSWLEFNVDEKDKVSEGLSSADSSKVTAGDIICRVGRMKTISMLHFELYEKGIIGTWPKESKTTGNKRWYQKDSIPPTYLLNPTNYLITLLGNNTPEKTRPKEIARVVETR